MQIRNCIVITRYYVIGQISLKYNAYSFKQCNSSWDKTKTHQKNACQWLATGRWFSPVSSTYKISHHDITEILLKVAFSTFTFTLTHLLVFVVITVIFFKSAHFLFLYPDAKASVILNVTRVHISHLPLVSVQHLAPPSIKSNTMPWTMTGSPCQYWSTTFCLTFWSYYSWFADKYQFPSSVELSNQLISRQRVRSHRRQSQFSFEVLIVITLKQNKFCDVRVIT